MANGQGREGDQKDVLLSTWNLIIHDFRIAPDSLLALAKYGAEQTILHQLVYLCDRYKTKFPIDINSALCASIKRHHNKVATFIVQEYFVNLDQETAPLLYATSKENEEIVQLLLENGADPNTNISFVGVHCFHIAAEVGNLNIATRLLDSGAHINSIVRDRGRGRSLTPIIRALERAKWQMAKLLFDRGADMPSFNIFSCGHYKFDYTCVDFLQVMVDFAQDSRRPRPGLLEDLLLETVHHGLIQSVDFLLDKGANLATLAERGADALRRGFSLTCIDPAPVLKLLIENGVDINVTDSSGDTPLLKVLQLQQKDKDATVQALVNAGADLDIADKRNGETPLHLAAYYGNKHRLQMLLDGGASIKLNNRGETPLYVARLFGHTDIVDYLSKYSEEDTSGERESSLGRLSKGES
ncbi:hypothetical protein FQN50_006463 [Emmonsiellopsis sp. PD_5]|nr:hypothetical protein FQN50_006463 [Emmonsiellopsis sp. PD_5]